MINEIYNVLTTIHAKEHDGYISPQEFNSVAKLVQDEIFVEYFDQLNRNRNRDNRNLVGQGLSNIKEQLEEKISVFYKTATASESTGVYTLPTDLYFLVKGGVTDQSSGRVIEELKRHKTGYVNKMSIFRSSDTNSTFPTYEKFGTTITVNPSGLGDISIKYVRKPVDPNWTYNEVSGNPVFNISDGTYQDFELHVSEFSNIAIRMASLFGLNLREADVVSILENMKNNEFQKENS